MPEDIEHQHAYGLAAGRRGDRGARAEESAEDSPGFSQAPAKVSPVVWGMWFGGALLATLIAYLSGFIHPFLTICINYMFVFAIWFWAKINGLKPATLFSAAKGLAGGALTAAGPEGQAASAATSAVDQVPGSDLVYIGLGGATSLAYLGALWNSNG